ncbi:MAG: YceD family protein [Coriobacteriia bacterium]|nr:YceD family protein [Coriobacteriia bacterium]
MQEIIIPLRPDLHEVGDAFNKTGHLELESYMVGEKTYKLPHGLDYDLIVSHTGEGILVTGMLTGKAVGECDRCLEPAYFDIAGEVEAYYFFEEPGENLDLDEDEYDMVSPDETIDITTPLQAALIFETPFVLLDDEACKGLCPVCGINLNTAPADHNHDDEMMDANPFAKLKDFKFDEENKKEN